MTARDGEPLRTHIVIYEAPVKGGRTAVPVRIGRDWGVVTGHAGPAAVWTLFAAARRWWRHSRQRTPPPDMEGPLTGELARAAHAWLQSARRRSGDREQARPEGHAEPAPPPRSILNPQHYIAEITARASRLAWDMEEGRDPAASTRELQATIEAYRRPRGKPPRPRPEPETIRRTQELNQVKDELPGICRELGSTLRRNLDATGSRKLQETHTKQVLRQTLHRIQDWYERYAAAARALPDPRERQAALATIDRRATAYPKRPRAQLRNAACNIEQRRRNQKDADPADLLRLLMNAAVAIDRLAQPDEDQTGDQT